MALNTFADARDPHAGSAPSTAAELGADALIVRRHGGAGLRARSPSAAAPASVGAGFGHHLGSHRVLPRALRHPARGAAARADAAAGRRTCSARRRRRDRGLRLRQPVRDGRGRCALSSYATGSRPTPPACARRRRRCAGNERPGGVEARLNGVLIDRYAPTNRAATRRCARAASTSKATRDYALEEPTSLNTLAPAAAADRGRREGDQDRGPPAQPGLRPNRSRACGAPPSTLPPGRHAIGAAGLDGALGAGPRASSTRWVPTTGRGAEPPKDLHERSHNTRIALTVGPLQYWWPRPPCWPSTPRSPRVGRRHRGARRGGVLAPHELKPDDWLALARDLAAAGKEVVLATPGAARIRGRAAHACAACRTGRVRRRGRRRVGAARCWPAARASCSVRTSTSTAAPRSLEHAALGAVRWVRAGRTRARRLSAASTRPAGAGAGPPGPPIATEVFAFGRMPLAFSARCFTARHHRLNKDDCDFRCIDAPDGLLLDAPARANPSSC
jgi:hypothetical protein